MDITSIVFGALFILFGVLVAIGKIHIHTEVWKQTPDKEKDKLNVKGLCHNVGEMIMLCGIIFLINGIWVDGKGYFFIIAIVSWLIICVLDLLFIYKSKHYRKDKNNEKEKLVKTIKKGKEQNK